MRGLKLDAAAAYLRENRRAARMAGMTALIVALSAWTSCSARKVTREAKADIREAVAIRGTATRFGQQFLPATTAETDEWGRTTQEAAEYGTAEALKVSLAQTVSRIAEVAGMSSAKASFTPTDSLGALQTRNIGDVAFQPATFGLRLEANGSLSALARVILRLPPATEITALSLSGDTGEPKATFQLAVYQPAGGPQN